VARCQPRLPLLKQTGSVTLFVDRRGWDDYAWSMPYYGVVWTFQPVKRDELKKVLDKFNEGSIAGGDESPSVACIVKADTSSKALKNSYDIVLDSDAVAVDGYAQRVTAGVERGNELQWWRELLQRVKVT
jgi:hypothetical protein